MKRLFIILSTLVIFILMGGIFAPVDSRAAAPKARALQQAAVDEAVKAAFEKAVHGSQAQVLGLLIYDTQVERIEYGQDGSVALVYVALQDSLTGEIIASEPGLSIAVNATRADPTDADNWQVSIQSAPDFADQVAALPPELLSEDLKMRFLTPEQPAQPQNSIQVFTGYKLPWAAGLEKRLSGSIWHILPGGSCTTTCRYAYDWADGTMFPLLASKGGVVKSFRYGCPNGSTSCTNFVVLEDQSTIPTTYQVYYHLAYNSLPEHLRAAGAQVLQGQYIGDVDDTGYSTGHHLHYHVFVSTTRSNYEWGYSVDFTYDDVAINGGHPRTCSEATNNPGYGTECMVGKDGKAGTADDNRFLSQNTPAHPPSGEVTAPANRQFITSQFMSVAGTATDDIQVTRVQVLGNWNDTWHTLDNITPSVGTGIFAKDVDLCAANVPEGPFKMMVKVFDREGGQAEASPGAIQLIKNFACGNLELPPAPPCTPNENQAALYSEPDFRGTCKKFDARDAIYSTEELGAVGDNSAASVQVGSEVQAVLLDLGDDVNVFVPEGRIETLEADDVNLSDNRIGASRVSGLQVRPRSSPPDEPFLPTSGSARQDSASLTSLDSVVLGWNSGIGGTSYDVILVGPNYTGTWTVSREASVSVGTLAPGDYTWTVVAHNSAGQNTATPSSFSVSVASLPAGPSRATPFSDDVEADTNGWSATGLWRRAFVQVGDRGATQAWLYNNTQDYGSAPGPELPWLAGDLTSPPIAIPSGSPVFLQFKYYADVEDGGPYWDQRRVQIVDEQGKATDLFQLSDDQQSTGQFWLKSPSLSLAAFAGQTIRIRFHFDAVDTQYNDRAGWMVDDITVNDQGPASGCEDADQNSPQFASAIAIDSTVNAAICSQGDVDYYRFEGQAGFPISIDIDAQSNGSALDAQVFLLGSDQRSIIAENDDEVLGDKTDPLLTYTLQRSGTYYIKVKAWDHPGAGGPNYTYRLNLKIAPARTPRSIQIIEPVDSKSIPTNPFRILVSAEDYDGGPIAQVEFYWHGPDWVNGNWIKLGGGIQEDGNWYLIAYPALYGDIRGAALYAQAKNAGGGALGAVMWDLEPDSVSPSSRLERLPGEFQTTVFLLTWAAEDPQNDIARFDLQYQANNGSGWTGWVDWASFEAGRRSVWFNGQAGMSYNFRMRAVDSSGNAEKYVDIAEATTHIATTCSPDSFEGLDHTAAGASRLEGGQSQVHNFCQNDVDWVSFELQDASFSILQVNSQSGGAAFSVNLYNSALEKIAGYASSDFGKSISQTLPGLSAGSYYLEISPLRSDLYGTAVSYRVFAGAARVVNLPAVSK